MALGFTYHLNLVYMKWEMFYFPSEISQVDKKKFRKRNKHEKFDIFRDLFRQFLKWNN
jgi:hypothetical protein